MSRTNRKRLAVLEEKAVSQAQPTAIGDIPPEEAAACYQRLMSQSTADAAPARETSPIPADPIGASRVYQQMINATPQQWAAMVRARHESKP